MLDEIYRGQNVANNIERAYLGSNLVFERNVGPVLDPATQALLDFAAFNSHTPASGNILTALDNFIKGLKLNNIWELLYVLYVWATNGDSNFAMYNLLDPNLFLSLRVGNPVFTPQKGYTGTGSSYINTQFNLLNDTDVDFDQNSSFGVGLLEDQTLTGFHGAQGANSSQRTWLFPSRVGNRNVNVAMNSPNNALDPLLTSVGFHAGNRSGGSPNIEYYYEGLLHDTAVRAVTAVPNLEFYFLAANVNGTDSFHTDGTAGIGWIGKNLSGKMAIFRSLWETYRSELVYAPPGLLNANDELVVAEGGQSNQEGRDGDTLNVNYPFNSTIGATEFDGVSKVVLNTDRGNASDGSHANYFADELFALSGKKAVMTEVASGGSGYGADSGTGTNNWGPTGTLRAAAETKVANALIANASAIPIMLWSGGENDAVQIDSEPSYTKADAKAAFEAIVDWWFGLYPDSYFFISQTGRPDPADTAGYQAVRELQQEVVDENARVIMAFSGAVNFPGEGKMSDNVHYTFSGYEDMGVGYAGSVNSNLFP